ncbi:MAG TPA: acyltransferase [Verrucomicrobiae bacterium]|nr:acyltransferase [Verrucomicrobiae bacterium]
MKEQTPPAPSPWTHGPLPAGVVVGPETRITADYAFKRYRARPPGELIIGANGTMDGVHFAVGESGRMVIGDFCYFTNAVLLCELEIRVGNYVMVGWNTTIADSDFHPIAPAERIIDAIACSPLAGKWPRPAIAMKPVVIEDDVWIGPNSTILKGVHIGEGAFIEAGSLVTRDIPAGARVLGNPAQILPPS